MTAKELLADSILACKGLMARFLTGFDDHNHTSQPPMMPNHIIWCLGHCALTMHRVAERLDAKPLPASDFVAAKPGGGTPRAYDTESVGFGSNPVDDAARYPTLTRGIAIYEAACERLSNSVRSANERTLNQKIPWGDTEISLWLLVARLVFHNGAHTGQIVDIRRALGLGGVLG